MQKILGKLESAEELLTSAVRLALKFHTKYSAVAEIALINLAKLYADTSRLDTAEELYFEALEINEALMGPNDISVIAILVNFADLSVNQMRFIEAKTILLRAKSIAKKHLGGSSYEYSTILNNLAEISRRAEPKNAETNFREARVRSGFPDVHVRGRNKK